MKAKVYIETTVVGHLTGRLPSDIVVAGQMLVTRNWWTESQSNFELFISELVLREVSQGDSTAAAERMEMIALIPSAPILETAQQLADVLIARHGLPEKARIDALHLAICATNNIDYLLTWNCRHLANATRQKVIGEICKSSGYNVPIICTPQQLKESKP